MAAEFRKKLCVREPRNAHDRYAVAVEKDGTVIGHLPKFRGGKSFVGLIFVVEGTHENFNTMKISVYTVSVTHNTGQCILGIG